MGAKLRTILALLIVGVIAVSMPAQSALNWHIYRSTFFGFAVTFPTTQVEALPVQVEYQHGVRVETYIFRGVVGDIVSLAGGSDYRTTASEPRLTLDRDSFLEEIHATLTSQRTLNFGNEKLSAIEFTFTSGDRIGKSLLVLKKFADRMTVYMDAILLPKNRNKNAADMDKFENSFQLISRGQ